MEQTTTLWYPSGKCLHSYVKSPFSMGKSTMIMAIFNSYVCLPEGNVVGLSITNMLFLFLQQPSNIYFLILPSEKKKRR